MDTTFSYGFDNNSELTHNGSTGMNATVTMAAVSKFSRRQAVSALSMVTVGLIVSGVGSCASAVVLAVLVRARKQFGSSVHTLIANQSAMDLFACLAAMLSLLFMITHGYSYDGSDPIREGAICTFFEGSVLTGVGITAEKVGLVVITLERYFKIVHAIAHRKYYRGWMTKVGVALPWVCGICLIVFPAMGTTRVVNGRCVRLGVWPNKAMETVSHQATHLVVDIE